MIKGSHRIGVSRLLIIAAYLLTTGCATTGIEFSPITDLHPSHLGITVEAPGSEDWVVTEKRYEAGWRIMFRYENPEDQSRTRLVFVKADRYDDGGFAQDHGSLQELARSVFEETRGDSVRTEDNPFQEKWAELVRDDIHGVEAYRFRIAWEERRNENFPDAVLILEVVQCLLLHPQYPDEVVSVAVSTRRRIEQEPINADTLASSFLRSMRFAK